MNNVQLHPIRKIGVKDSLDIAEGGGIRVIPLDRGGRDIFRFSFSTVIKIGGFAFRNRNTQCHLSLAVFILTLLAVCLQSILSTFVLMPLFHGLILSASFTEFGTGIDEPKNIGAGVIKHNYWGKDLESFFNDQKVLFNLRESSESSFFRNSTSSLS